VRRPRLDRGSCHVHRLLLIGHQQRPSPSWLVETSRPARRADAPPSEPVERHRGRESGAGRLEQAITVALQTLGVGQPAAASTPSAAAAAPTAIAAEAVPTAAAAGDATTRSR